MGSDSSNWFNKAEHSVPQPAESQRHRSRKPFIHGIITGACLWLLFNVSGFRLQIWRYKPLNDSERTLDEYFKPGDCIQEADWNTYQVFYPSALSTSFSDSKHAALGASPDLFGSVTVLDLPLGGNESFHLQTLEFLSRGCYSGGTFNIITSPVQPKDTVTFQVSSISKSESRPKLCKASRLGHQGVGIFTPECSRYMRNRNLLDFKLHTTIILPELDEESGPLLIEDFRTDLINTEQVIGDIGSRVFFKRLSLKGNDEKVIEAESVSGAHISIRSTRGAIRGTFNSTSYLVLETSNAPIFVNVNLNYTGQRTPPFLRAATSNSPISAKINLFERHRGDNIPASAYSVAAVTTNSPVEIDIQSAPLNSRLGITAKTTNSPSTVNVPPTFEGSFYLSTTIAEPEIDEVPNTVDPSGRGRFRSFEYSNVQQNLLSGKVYWGDAEIPSPNYQYIIITTTNSPAILTL